MKAEQLEEFYVEELKDLHDAEKQLMKALPRMSKAASHGKLRMALDRHAKQTAEQAGRLEKILKARGTRGVRKCKAMSGLLAEATESMREQKLPELRDIALVTAAQKVEHYEIASYGCVATYAKQLGLDGEAKILHKTLDEEKATDNALTRLAEKSVNLHAADQSQSRQFNRGSTRASSRSNGRSQKISSASHAKSGGSKTAEAHTTTDHEEIRHWVEARGGKPVTVARTHHKGDAGLLRIDFPGYTGGKSLEAIPWDEWFHKFDETHLAFLYQERTKNGKESRFCKLIRNH